MKQKILFSIFLVLTAQASDIIDPIERAIIKHDHATVEYYLDQTTLTTAEKQKYLKIAQLAVQKAKNNLTKKFNSNEDLRMLVGLLGISGSAWSCLTAYEVYKDTADDSRTTGQYMGICAVLLGYLSTKEFFKGFFEYDRQKAYTNARFIEFLLKAN